MRVTAVDGMIMAPLYVTRNDSSPAVTSTLQVTKSGATYFIQGGTPTAAISLVLPPLAGGSVVGAGLGVAVAGFKARFVMTSALLGSNNVSIIPPSNAAGILTTPLFYGAISNSSSLTLTTPTVVGTLSISALGTVTGSPISVATDVVCTSSSRILPGTTLASISFVAGTTKALAGDWIEFETDGLSWFVRGVTKNYSAVTTA
jgi:hypothetical protein